MTDSQFAVLADPFAMLVRPEAVLQAIEQSGRRGALASRVGRALGKPLSLDRDGGGQSSFDDNADGNADEPEATPY